MMDGGVSAHEHSDVEGRDGDNAMGTGAAYTISFYNFKNVRRILRRRKWMLRQRK
jgi:hypothetical protein